MFGMGGNLLEALVTLAMIAIIPGIPVAVAVAVWLIVRRTRTTNEPSLATPSTDAGRPEN
jgi:hypothetical protein